MPLLITLVRASIRLNAVKMLKPIDASIESQRCAAWFAIREAYPRVHTGRLETTIREGALASLRRCRECRHPMLPEDRGQWNPALCGTCEHASVTVAIANLNDAPANDTSKVASWIAGYVRCRANREACVYRCLGCVSDPMGPYSDWSAVNESEAAGMECDECGELLDALPSMVAVTQ